MTEPREVVLGRRRFVQAAGLLGSLAVVGAPQRAAAAAARPEALGSGQRLYDVVQRYSRWPHHRTGTGLGQATTRFFENQLRLRGARTARSSYPIDLYTWDARVSVDGRPIQTLPVYHEAVGTASTTTPFIRSVTLPFASTVTPLQTAINAAAAAGAEIAVVPTFGRFPAANGIGAPFLPYGPYADLIGVNMHPDGPRSGVHTLLVSGEHAAALASGSVSASVSASITPGLAENVLGWFGPDAPDPFIITTPLSGWFNCAGERGTGIAIALDLAADLGREGVPVFVLGTTGHEYENHGVEHFLDDHALSPRAVFHIGASAAAGWTHPQTGELVLSPTRIWKSSVSSAALDSAMQQGSFSAWPDWVGEAPRWLAEIGASPPLLSTSGATTLFHTPHDVPERATSPALLETAYRSMRAGALALL
ncbi:hypothetical protein FHP29_00280 [Nocardioides albidus]|uniref:Uncharacterized protein n=1 Tax=Nocardioides albidus TaxID=1517589 RepID=A0A5C4WR93_9ACTN|nr:hypothetical protein [Nocardioides albidus]TNM50788.1 hypothetical protein FHP29_00280 [Nocardioides albidus]